MTGDNVRLPTDIDILTTMADRKRQTSTNLASILNKDRRYMTNRLNFLREEGYLRDPGPADNSRMVEITPMGLVAVFRKDKLVREHYSRFTHLCERVADCNRNLEQRFLPDLIATEYGDNWFLRRLNKIDGLTIPSEFSDEIPIDDQVLSDIDDVLYQLSFWSLADRKDGMDVYKITQRGKQYLELLPESAFEYQTFDLGIEDYAEFTEQLRGTYTKEEMNKLENLTNFK